MLAPNLFRDLRGPRADAFPERGVERAADGEVVEDGRGVGPVKRWLAGAGGAVRLRIGCSCRHCPTAVGAVNTSFGDAAGALVVIMA
jgi:hypothetical protein